MESKYHWKPVKEYKEILFHKFEGIARISINRPKVHNAFTPLTVEEMIDATADWQRRGGATLGKPTHFEVRDGEF